MRSVLLVKRLVLPLLLVLASLGGSTATAVEKPTKAKQYCIVGMVGASREAPGYPRAQAVPFVACLNLDGSVFFRWWDPPTECVIGSRVMRSGYSWSCGNSARR